MNHMIIPPYEPKSHEPVRPPMIYIEKKLKWEYKQIARNLKKEKPLDEAELNALGEERRLGDVRRRSASAVRLFLLQAFD